MNGVNCMNIEQIDESRVLITLCDEDMENYSVSFESLSLSDNHTRSVLKKLMYYASDRTGISFEKKHILIEALRYEHGCILLFTVSEKSGKKKIYRIKYYNDSYIFTFENAEALLSCIQALYLMNDSRFASSVYFRKDRYYLVINSPAALKPKYICTISEFCTHQFRGRIHTAVLREHAKPVYEKNAIEVIGKTLCSSKS